MSYSSVRSHAVEAPVEVSVSAKSSKLLQLGAALMLGVVMLSSAVAVQLPAVHNAAHDMRHSQGFPCH